MTHFTVCDSSPLCAAPDVPDEGMTALLPRVTCGACLSHLRTAHKLARARHFTVAPRGLPAIGDPSPAPEAPNVLPTVIVTDTAQARTWTTADDSPFVSPKEPAEMQLLETRAVTGTFTLLNSRGEPMPVQVHRAELVVVQSFTEEERAAIRAEWMAYMTQGTMTRNEVRALEGFSPLQGEK